MRFSLAFIMVLVSAAAAPSLAAPKAATKTVPKLIQSCDAHKFETVVDTMAEGQPHQSKVKLCGVEGQSDAEWIDTLRDAIKKLDANKDMPPGQRDQIVSAIKTEIARLTILGAGPVVPRQRRPAIVVPEQPLSRDYATLPPLPLPSDPAASSVQKDMARPAPVPAPEYVPVQKDFAQLPPMPPPLAPVPSTAAAPAVFIPVAAPRLNFGCDTPGDLSTDAPCAEFDRETTLTIHAGEDVPAGTLLQFVRNGQPQADVPLGGLRRGAVLRVALPAKVCTGFGTGKLELRILREDASGAPRSLSAEGPYSLRC